MLLEVRDIYSGYGKLTILHGVSIDADEGEIVMLIGANGAGKTTLMKTISGHLRPTAGEVRLAGERIDGLGASGVAMAGVGYVPQEQNVFGEMSVLDNLRIGALDDPDAVEEALTRFPILAERAAQRADTLSGGERQILAISAALVSRPRVLLLDEPTSGLAPLFVDQIVQWITTEASGGTSVIWVVEQNPEPILRVSQRVFLMEGGQLSDEMDAGSLLEPGRLERLLLADQYSPTNTGPSPESPREKEQQ